MFNEFQNINILGISSCVPKNKLELKSLSDKFGQLDVYRIAKNTGIHAVRIAEKNVKTSDLCIAASAHLIDKLNISKDSINAVIFVSQTPDSLMPATSVKLQHRLGLNRSTLGFDISYGCSGYLYGLFQAALLIQQGNFQKVLVCSGDVISPYMHQDDKNIRMVFGDGGSATIVEKGQNKISFLLKSDGSGAADLQAKNYEWTAGSGEYEDSHYAPMRTNYIQMNGTAIMDFALKEVPDIIHEILEHSQFKKENISTYALHQANALILHYLRRKLSINKEQVPIYIEDVGNTGPASIPLMLTELGSQLQRDNLLKNTLLCGFGVGLSWGAAITDLSSTQFIKKIEI